MFRPRLLLGAVIGGALVYFLDPERGEARRARLTAWWEQNRDPMMDQAAAAASNAQAKVNEASSRVGEKVTELQSKVRNKTDDVTAPVQ
jgi:gas vesicle protein